MNLQNVMTWFRAATQRLTAARVLEANALYLDAAYLAGYVMECALKGLVLSRVPERKRKQFIVQRFHSAKAHDFVYSWWLVTNTGVQVPPRIVECIRRTAWSPDLRYSVGLGDHDDAAQIIKAGGEVLTWARNNA